MTKTPTTRNEMRLAAVLAALLMLPLTAIAQHQATAQTPQGRIVTVTALTDNILKVTNTATGEQVPYSAACVIDEPQGNATVTQLTPDISVLSTPAGMTATIDAATGSVVINAGPDKVVTDKGVRTSINGKQVLTLYTTSQGSYYGAGERGHKLNLRGDTLVMYNRQNYGYTGNDPRISQMNITMPLFLSTDGFAIVFDDYAAATMALGRDITYTTESREPVSFYFVNGARTLADVTTALTSLTGRQPLPPLWSLGYITSKYGYRTQAETVGAIDSLKRDGYPVDGIVLDLYWYGKEQDMGRLAWEPEQWPDPEGMLRSLKNRNVNLVAISQPYILRNGKALDNYNYLADSGMLVADSTGTAPQEVVIWVGEGGMFDVSNPETRAWMANRYKTLTDMGITGWWGDLGEPEVHPETGMHDNGKTARLYHNQYGNDWSEIIYDLFTEEYPDTRLLTMMRGGTTGLQRYSVFPWSTDVSRSWGGLEPQIRIMLNSGLSGLGYMGHDVGGFAIDPENPTDPELYVRWMQLGLFSPMLRTHAQYNAEPYHYPQYHDILLRLVKERYRWLPYNYSIAYQNSAFGYPLVRPLNFTEADGTTYDNITDEFLWGPEVLVAPVITAGATERAVTFPTGMWIDYNNPSNQYQGGTTVTYPAPLDVLPLFVRAGSIIPQADYRMESTADYKTDRFTIKFFPAKGENGRFSLYDDNRTSPGTIQSGQFRLIDFQATTDDDGTSTIRISSEGDYIGAPRSIELNFIVEGAESRPSSVLVNGRRTANRYNSGTRTVTFKVDFIPGQSTTITINR